MASDKVEGHDRIPTKLVELTEAGEKGGIDRESFEPTIWSGFLNPQLLTYRFMSALSSSLIPTKLLTILPIKSSR